MQSNSIKSKTQHNLQSSCYNSAAVEDASGYPILFIAPGTDFHAFNSHSHKIMLINFTAELQQPPQKSRLCLKQHLIDIFKQLDISSFNITCY